MTQTWKHFGIALLLQACQSTPKYDKTVGHVDINRFMGTWYVIANRPTMFETDAFNATETYTLNDKTGKIDVDFRYNKKSFDGDEKNIPQVASVFNKQTNAHWHIGVWYLPINLDYLIIDLDPQYQWTAVGVPNQKYLWIMSRLPHMEEKQLQEILNRVAATGYSIEHVDRVPQQAAR